MGCNLIQEAVSPACPLFPVLINDSIYVYASGLLYILALVSLVTISMHGVHRISRAPYKRKELDTILSFELATGRHNCGKD